MAGSRTQHNGRLAPLPNVGLRKRKARRMITVQQAAQSAGVDESTIRRALASGRLKGDKPGRDWLVDTESLAAFVPRRLNRAGAWHEEE